MRGRRVLLPWRRLNRLSGVACLHGQNSPRQGLPIKNCRYGRPSHPTALRFIYYFPHLLQSVINK